MIKNSKDSVLMISKDWMVLSPSPLRKEKLIFGDGVLSAVINGIFRSLIHENGFIW